jgi:hypothetical protein
MAVPSDNSHLAVDSIHCAGIPILAFAACDALPDRDVRVFVFHIVILLCNRFYDASEISLFFQASFVMPKPL